MISHKPRLTSYTSGGVIDLWTCPVPGQTLKDRRRVPSVLYCFFDIGNDVMIQGGIFPSAADGAGKVDLLIHVLFLLLII